MRSRRITLTGAQLIAYLDHLDQDAHPGYDTLATKEP